MSNLRTPNAPNVGHDIDDESLLVSPGVVAFASDTGSDVTKVSSGVVVTTTIHRQSKPTMDRKESLEDDIETIGESESDFPLRPVVYTPGQTNVSEPPRTRIQGGARPQHQRTKTLSFSRPLN